MNTFTLVDDKTGQAMNVQTPVGLTQEQLRTLLLTDAAYQDQCIASLGRPISWVRVMKRQADAGTGELPVTLMAAADITDGAAAAAKCADNAAKAAATRLAPVVNVPGSPVQVRNTRTPAAPAAPTDRKQALMNGGMTEAEAVAFLRGKYDAALGQATELATVTSVVAYTETLTNLAQAAHDLDALQTLIASLKQDAASLAEDGYVLAHKEAYQTMAAYAAYAPAIMSSSDGF